MVAASASLADGAERNTKTKNRYAPSNYKYRAVDVVLPWLMRGCGVDMVTSQFYRVDPKLQKLREDMDARAAAAGVDVAACSDLWRGKLILDLHLHLLVPESQIDP